MTCPVDKFEAVKDPTEVLDYVIDWLTNVLSATDPIDTIATSTWSITDDDGSLIIDQSSHDGALSTVWLSGGGKLGTFHKVVNHIVTTNVPPREYERTVTVEIRNK